jgi:hypothetical protein
MYWAEGRTGRSIWGLERSDGALYEHGTESLSRIKCGRYRDYLSNCYLACLCRDSFIKIWTKYLNFYDSYNRVCFSPALRLLFYHRVYSSFIFHFLMPRTKNDVTLIFPWAAFACFRTFWSAKHWRNPFVSPLLQANKMAGYHGADIFFTNCRHNN